MLGIFFSHFLVRLIAQSWAIRLPFPEYPGNGIAGYPGSKI